MLCFFFFKEYSLPNDHTAGYYYYNCPRLQHSRRQINPFQNDKVFSLPNSKRWQTTILNLMKIAESFPNRWKTLRKKEKLLVTSNFSVFHSVFKKLAHQTIKNQGLFGKGLYSTTMIELDFKNFKDRFNKGHLN